MERTKVTALDGTEIELCLPEGELDFDELVAADDLETSQGTKEPGEE